MSGRSSIGSARGVVAGRANDTERGTVATFAQPFDGHQARARREARRLEGVFVHRRVAVDESTAALVEGGQPLDQRDIVDPQYGGQRRRFRSGEFDGLVETGIAQAGQSGRQTRRTLGVASTVFVLSKSLMGDDQDHARARS